MDIAAVGMNSSSPLFIPKCMPLPRKQVPIAVESVKLIDNNELLIKMENGKHKSHESRAKRILCPLIKATAKQFRIKIHEREAKTERRRRRTCADGG